MPRRILPAESRWRRLDSSRRNSSRSSRRMDIVCDPVKGEIARDAVGPNGFLEIFVRLFWNFLLQFDGSLDNCVKIGVGFDGALAECLYQVAAGRRIKGYDGP